jgi:3-hydroxyacyl-CoA dehydrogenase
MGGGIAALLASAGIKTLLLDIVPFDLSDEEKKDPKSPATGSSRRAWIPFSCQAGVADAARMPP